jgi:two-component system alkaline phosphatase synthesis response regulator PhoP
VPSLTLPLEIKLECMNSILIIDPAMNDEAQPVRVLKSHGFDISIANSVEDGIRMAQSVEPSIVFIELEFEKEDGIELCTELRRLEACEKSMIVFYTNVTDSYAQIAAYNAGGDDYILKSVSAHLLLCKVKSLLRRVPVKGRNKQNNCTEFQMDFSRYLIEKDGNQLYLPRKEFEILALFAQQPSKVFTRSEIINEVWDRTEFVQTRTVDVHIRKIREKIGNHLIRTIKGVGYKLDCC